MAVVVVFLTLLIMVICGIIQSSNAYGFTYTPTDITQQQINKQDQIKAIHDSGLPFPKYIHQISTGAGNPKNTSALADYKAIQKHMQTIEKSIPICNNPSSDAGFKDCMDKTAFAYETYSGDSSIYKSVCNNAIIEGILKTTNPSAQDLNDRAYKEAGVVLGSSTGNFATTTAAAANVTTTNTQLKTYTDPAGLVRNFNIFKFMSENTAHYYNV